MSKNNYTRNDLSDDAEGYLYFTDTNDSENDSQDMKEKDNANTTPDLDNIRSAGL